MLDQPGLRLPPAASPLEGIYLLAVLMRSHLERLKGLRPLLAPEQAKTLAGLEADVAELHWRMRAVLAEPDPGPEADAPRLALLELAGLAHEADPPMRVKGWLDHSRRRRLLEEVESGLGALARLADQARERFAGDALETEFRLTGQVAREQAPRVQQLRREC